MPRISLAFVAPEAVKWPLKFERPGIHLGVWRDGEPFFVRGAATR